MPAKYSEANENTYTCWCQPATATGDLHAMSESSKAMPTSRLATTTCIRLNGDNSVGRNGIPETLVRTEVHLLNFSIYTNILIVIPVHSGTKEKCTKGNQW